MHYDAGHENESTALSSGDFWKFGHCFCFSHVQAERQTIQSGMQFRTRAGTVEEIGPCVCRVVPQTAISDQNTDAVCIGATTRYGTRGTRPLQLLRLAVIFAGVNAL